MDAKALYSQINTLFATKHYEEIKPLLLSYKEITEKDNALATIFYLCGIYEKERDAGDDSLFTKVNSVDELLERYTCLKFLLRRLDFGVSDNGIDELYRFLSEYHVSSYELVAAVNFVVVNKDKVWKEIKGL